MVRDRFARRVSLKGGANHGWFAAVLRVGCRLKGVQTMDGLRTVLRVGCRLKGVQTMDGLRPFCT